MLDVSSIGPLPWLTLAFWTSIRTHLSLTAMCGCRCRVHTPFGWSVPHIDAHIKKNEPQLRSAVVQDWGKRQGSDALRGQVLTIYSTMTSIILLSSSILSALDLQTWPNYEELLSNSASEISLITSKTHCFSGPRVEAVSSASCPCHLHRSQECCLVTEERGYSATLGNASRQRLLKCTLETERWFTNYGNHLGQKSGMRFGRICNVACCGPLPLRLVRCW